MYAIRSYYESGTESINSENPVIQKPTQIYDEPKQQYKMQPILNSNRITSYNVFYTKLLRAKAVQNQLIQKTPLYKSQHRFMTIQNSNIKCNPF